jgi:nitronate monooxygenase
MDAMVLPAIIQGGMGAGISGWPLARAVSRAGQLGVVAGTALDVILARRLQSGDPGGHLRRALERFPIAGVAERILARYFVAGGKPEDEPFRGLPLLDAPLPAEREELIVAANFAEVFLAKEGHAGAVGINYLEKIQLPTLPSLFGAMLAGVDTVLMGAGIPRAIPGVLDELAAGRPVRLRVDVRDAEHWLRFDPSAFAGGAAPPLARPRFLAIVSSATVASVLARKASGRVDGLIVEGSTAGGHNAPVRGPVKPDASGETVFGERDVPDLAAIARLGLPFWLAGSCAGPEHLAAALDRGAAGVQVGTAFAFCDESGLRPDLKERARERIRSGTARVATDALASPTGFPFKVFELAGTLSERDVFAERERVCDLGYLRHPYVRPDGRLSWRCPGEPERAYLKKGGAAEELRGRKCICNGLMADIGLGQVQRGGAAEPPILTSGSETGVVAELLAAHGGSYTAAHVLEHLLGTAAAR